MYPTRDKQVHEPNHENGISSQITIMKPLFKIGHYTDLKNITGCTVILCPPQALASCTVCGAAPGSRELALLAPDKKIEFIHAVLLSGGSAFGLNAAAGVMQFLEEQKTGYATAHGLIPIVPAAVIYDLNIGNNLIRPSAENAYRACREAIADFSAQGSIGAATGATVGKWAGISCAMKSGLGISTITLRDAWITALSVVNAVGDILDEHGSIIAGAIDQKREFIARQRNFQRWITPAVGLGENTILSVVLTNIKLTKLQAYILACRSQNGLARAVVPATTSYDGDVIFTISHGEVELDPDITYEMGSEAVRLSIIQSASLAKGLGGFLSASDLHSTD
jgi:L-aminopeptidase/D-esterase-like protein